MGKYGQTANECQLKKRLTASWPPADGLGAVRFGSLSPPESSRCKPRRYRSRFAPPPAPSRSACTCNRIALHDLGQTSPITNSGQLEPISPAQAVHQSALDRPRGQSVPRPASSFLNHSQRQAVAGVSRGGSHEFRRVVSCPFFDRVGDSAVRRMLFEREDSVRELLPPRPRAARSRCGPRPRSRAGGPSSHSCPCWPPPCARMKSSASSSGTRRACPPPEPP
jgi:hypothetical protein